MRFWPQYVRVGRIPRLWMSPVKFERDVQPYFIFVAWETRVFSSLKPNTNLNKTRLTVDVRHSHVKHCSYVNTDSSSRITGERETLLINKILQWCEAVHLMSTVHNSVVFVFACLWTHLDRPGLKFMFVLQCFRWKERQSNCNVPRVTQDVRYMT